MQIKFSIGVLYNPLSHEMRLQGSRRILAGAPRRTWVIISFIRKRACLAVTTTRLPTCRVCVWMRLDLLSNCTLVGAQFGARCPPIRPESGPLVQAMHSPNHP